MAASRLLSDESLRKTEEYLIEVVRLARSRGFRRGDSQSDHAGIEAEDLPIPLSSPVDGLEEESTP